MKDKIINFLCTATFVIIVIAAIVVNVACWIYNIKN